MDQGAYELLTASYLRWVVLLPLIGAIVNGIPGAAIQRVGGKRAISIIGCTPVIAAFALAVFGLRDLMLLEPANRLLLDRLFTWLHVGDLNVDVAFQLDPLSAVMILVVTGVGGLIHIYSIGYMREEPSYWRYFAYLNLFTLAMLVLVLADNLLLMFVGWEGVGLCSYALIGFWYSDWSKASAGSKAFIVNRIGDFGFMLGMFLLFWVLAGFGHPTLTFREISQHVPLLDGHVFWSVGTVTLITLLLFVGAVGKSAQLPLHVWLPDAMAGPTPVSALIHAATMVTAGVYMIARLNFLYSMAPATLMVVAIVGTATALFAATIGTAQNDIKKVLAYSTISQLGYMFIAMGVGAYAAGIFHLTTHALFKACLFLGSGSVIQAMHHEQDIRRMGGLRRRLPCTYWTFLVSTLAIVGIPPLSGFISKDGILGEAFAKGHHVLWGVGLSAALLTAFYMFRLLFMTFHGECRADHHTNEHLRESPRSMTVPLVILAALAAAAGVLGWPRALGGVNLFERWLGPVMGAHASPAHGAAAHAANGPDPAEYVTMALAVVVALTGVLIARAMYSRKSMSPAVVSGLAGGRLYRAVLNKYYVDEFYETVFVNGTLWLTRIVALFDLYVIDGIVNAAAQVAKGAAWLEGLFDEHIVDGAVNGVAAALAFVGGRVRRLQTGSINAYLYVIVIAVVGVMVVRLL